MTEAENIVFEISGRSCLACYQDLIRAVQVVYEQLPVQPLMKDIAAAAGARTQPVKGVGAVSRALARAAEDAWENGGRRALEAVYGFHTKPSPRELILKLAQALKKPAEYRIWREPSTGKCGVIARVLGEERWLAVAPFYPDEAKITALIRILNRSQTSLEDFRELFFNNSFPDLPEGGSAE